MIQGYHVYKDIWSDPDDEAVLECKCKPGNSSDPYALAVLKRLLEPTQLLDMFQEQYLQYALFFKAKWIYV